MKTTHFDPSEQETKELVYAKETTPDMYTEDTNADPEGAAARVVHTADYPAYLFDTFRLDEDGKLTPRNDVVETALTYYTAYGDSSYAGEDAEDYVAEVEAGIQFIYY